MEFETKERKETPSILINSELTIEMIIPQCCREGWASCKHVPKKQRKAKRNIGL